MAWDLSTDPEDFSAAATLFRLELGLTEDEFAEVLSAARERAFKVAGLTDLQLVSDVWKELERAEEEGLSFQEFKETFGDSVYEAWGERQPWRLDRLFRTNVQQGYSLGRYGVMTNPTVLEERPFWKFSAIDDSRLCEVCAECNGVVLPADDPWWQENWPPLHPQCIPIAEPVSGSFVGGLSALHRGKILQVRTARGHRLRVTPDHPVLTPRGFVPAQQLRQGSDVLSQRRRIDPGSSLRPLTYGHHEENRPAQAQEVLRALREQHGLLSRGRPRSLDLYGQALAVEGDVDVVGPGRLLLSNHEARRAKFLRKLVLVPAVNLRSSIRSGNKLGHRRHSSATRLVRCSCPPRFLRVRHLRTLQPLRCGTASQNDARRLESRSKTGPGDASFVRELLERGSGQIATDQIVEIVELSFTGHVADLESVGGWFAAGGLIVANCRCTSYSLSRDEAHEEGVDEEGPDVDAADGFGEVPDLSEMDPSLEDYPDALRAIFEEKHPG